MFIFKKEKTAQPKKYLASDWDENLYQSLFSEIKSYNPFCIYYFHFFIHLQNCKIDSMHNFSVINEYSGIYKKWLNEKLYCDIPVNLKIKDESEFFNIENRNNIGNISFTLDIDGGRSRPALDLILIDKNSLNKNISLLYSQTKFRENCKVRCFCSISLNQIKNMNAEEAWGNWHESFERDSDDKLTSEIPVGRQPFSIESISFEAEL